ncbi:hypothetical protein FB451DRAFT_1292761 [Mycena latifolia]|nr:hypothetical protein FB451DRAFT_1292761 [Mycena latifolia]
MSPDASAAPALPGTRIAALVCELLLCATASFFLLTFVLLPFFELHPSPLLVVRVTGLTSLGVFAALHAIFRTMLREPPAALPNDNPEFKLTPRRGTPARDAEAAWPREKGEPLGTWA